MKKNSIILFISMLFSLGANARTDSTESVIYNGRQLLINSVTDRDYESAAGMYQHLSAFTAGSGYDAFHYAEDLYIQFLLANWEEWFNLAIHVKEQSNRNVPFFTYPISEQLYYELIIDSDSLLKASEAISPYDDERDVLKLFIHYLKNGTDNNYNKQIKEFKKKYPSSLFLDFINDYMPSPFDKTSLGGFLGSGVIIPTSSLHSGFSPRATFSISIDLNYKRLYSSLYADAGGLRLKHPFTSRPEYFGTVQFDERDRFAYLSCGLQGGYFLIRNDRFHVAPYAAIGMASLESTVYIDDRENYTVKIFDSFTYGAGLNTEVRLTAPGNINYFSLKLDCGYNVIPNFKYDQFSGNTFYIRAGLVLGTGDF